MASVATGAGDAAERAVFVRKATGLVRGWSTRDAFIYAAFSINLITLGLYIFGYRAVHSRRRLIWAVLLAGGYLIVEGITYASLIAAMPRAGGDYVWISRVLGGGIGFVLAVTGWWFILSHWVPIYANILNVEVLRADARDHRFPGAAPSADCGLLGQRRNGIFSASVADRHPRVGLHRARHAVVRQGPEVLLLRRPGRAAVMILLCSSTRRSFITRFNEQSKPLRRRQRLPGNARRREGLHHTGARLLPVQAATFRSSRSSSSSTSGRTGARRCTARCAVQSDFRKNIYAMAGRWSS